MNRRPPPPSAVRTAGRGAVALALRAQGLEPSDAPGALAAAPVLAMINAMVSAAIAAAGAYFVSPVMWPELARSGGLLVGSVLVGLLILLSEVAVMHATRIAMPRRLPDHPDEMPGLWATVAQRSVGIAPRLLLTVVLVFTIGQMWAVVINRDPIEEQMHDDAVEAKDDEIDDRLAATEELIASAHETVRIAHRRHRSAVRMARRAEARANCEMDKPYWRYRGLVCSGIPSGRATRRALHARERAWRRQDETTLELADARGVLDGLVERRDRRRQRLDDTLPVEDFIARGWSDTLSALRKHADAEDFSVVEEWWPEATIVVIDISVLLWMLLALRNGVDVRRWRRELREREDAEYEDEKVRTVRVRAAQVEEIRKGIELKTIRRSAELEGEAAVQRLTIELEAETERLRKRAASAADSTDLQDDENDDPTPAPFDPIGPTPREQPGSDGWSTYANDGETVRLSDLVAEPEPTGVESPPYILPIGTEIRLLNRTLKIVGVLADPTAPGAACANYILEALMTEAPEVVEHTAATRFALKILGPEPEDRQRNDAWHAELNYAQARPDMQDGCAVSIRGGWLPGRVPPTFVTGYELYTEGNLYEVRRDLIEIGHQLSVLQLLGICRQLIVGARSVARAGFLHNDIRVVNVFITETLHAVPPAAAGLEYYRPSVLGDFNSVSLIHQPPAPGRALVSASEGAPELVARHLVDDEGPLRANPSALSDLYGIFGVVFYAMTGHHPGHLDHRESGHVQDPPPLARLRPDIPIAVGALIDTAVRTRPEHRFGGHFADMDAVAVYTAVIKMLDDCVASLVATGTDLHSMDGLKDVDLGRLPRLPGPTLDDPPHRDQYRQQDSEYDDDDDYDYGDDDPAGDL